MKLDEYTEMARLETFYWWFVARRKLLGWLLTNALENSGSPTILDVGSGTGANLKMLSGFGTVAGLDISAEALRFSRQNQNDRLFLSGLENMAVVTNAVDVVTALDVLEHVDDDVAAMAELLRVMRPGGLAMITVPAYGFLWSEHDEALHHRRRYTSCELRNKLTQCGFEVERISYYITFLFFPILAVRILQNIFKRSTSPKTSHIILPKWVNALLAGILDVERFLLRFMNLPFGVSVVCLARKKNADSVTPPPMP